LWKALVATANKVGVKVMMKRRWKHVGRDAASAGRDSGGELG